MEEIRYNNITVYTYSYDAWGNIIQQKQIATGGNTANSLNPFRYRGYYYDSETGWYYLNSRYYHPGTGRFINGDELISTGQGLLGFNMFAYCNNSPVMLVDAEGNVPVIVAGLVLLLFVPMLTSCSGNEVTQHVEVNPGTFETPDDAITDFGQKYLDRSKKRG